MIRLSSGLSYFDLNFMDLPRIIATGVVHGAGGVALVDPGPTSTLPRLRSALATAGLSIDDVSTVLLTHIHLDHAGATGSLVRERPRIRVYVHEKGAPHVADPTKLLASATRLYGDAMGRLWGEVLPVPPSSINVLQGGERIAVSTRTLDVEYTPGHASHHVSFFDRDSGIAFVGDTGGVRLMHGGFVMPPTPPPDVDLEAWHHSLGLIDRWRPETLFLTHFGPSSPVGNHLTSLRDHITLTSGLARRSLARDGTDADREAWFADELRNELTRRMNHADAHAYEVAGRFDLNWRGLARYWRKRGVTP
ncbi:MAG TPA: MBL fold metallo-hydrolase [Vicinamibacterales bacterium]|nr:MBL fold metallo-hydrolase [Vicinamibacterales bacterium]